jgi:hypothetical protein
MNKLFAYCLFAYCLFALSSCLTVDKIHRNCAKFAQICATGSETITIKKDTTIFRNDTIFFELPSDTVKLTDTIKVINNKAFLRPVNKEFGLIGVTAWANFNVLNVNAWLRDSTILIPHRDTVFLPGAITTTTATNTVTVREKFIPKLYKLALWIIIIQVTAAAFFIAGYLLRFKFKLLKIK